MATDCCFAAILSVLGILLVAAVPCRTAHREEPLSIGFRKQLMVDDYIISRRSGVTRELGQAIKANGGGPVLVADRPWEKATDFRVGSVFRENKKFRMWYRLGDEIFGYAESEDGLHWKKPSLGIEDYQGSRDNNIVNGMGFTCFLDAHEIDPAHKYKAAYTHPKVMAALAHSPDGFRWTPYNNGEPVTHRAADTINQLLWDEDAKLYRLCTRTDFGPGGGPNEKRGTRDMTNPDVKANPTAWKTIRNWQFDRQGPEEYKRRQIYSLNGWIYEGVHFGLLWCYEWVGDLSEGPYDLHKRHERDIMDFYLLATRGENSWGLSWVYAGKPLIPRGPDGSFDKDWVQPATNIVTWQDRHWIYYSGSKERHNVHPRPRECSIGLATLRLDGFVYLQGKDEWGTVETKPFRLEGRRLEVNVDANSGEFLVEVLDAAGKPIPGFSRKNANVLRAVDGVRLQPGWRSHADLAALKGRGVRLKFHLREAKLYAFQVRP